MWTDAFCGRPPRCNPLFEPLFLSRYCSVIPDPGMHSSRPRWVQLLVLSFLVLSVSGCATIQEVSNLRKVNFQLDRVAETQLAGVEVGSLRSYEDLSATNVLRLGSALSKGEMPLSFNLHVQATNPESNSVDARLTQMDWTLLLEDKETVSGQFDQEVVLPPGQPQDVSFRVELDLVRFFDDNLKGLVNLASAISGDAPSQNIKLRVQPTVNTMLGPVKYPSPITVVSKEVGGSNTQQP